MNFDNPVYRKTTEEQFALEKSDHEDHTHSFQSVSESHLLLRIILTMSFFFYRRAWSHSINLEPMILFNVI